MSGDAKFFHRHYATRESAGAIRDSALGEILARHAAPAVELGTDQVRISVFVSDASLKFETQSTVYVRFELEDGLHMYGRPLPDMAGRSPTGTSRRRRPYRTRAGFAWGPRGTRRHTLGSSQSSGSR